MNKTLIAYFLCSLVACLAGPPAAQADDSAALSKIANADHRSEAHRDRNQYRHPAATLKFFGLEPDMNVLEIWPGGGGWYTEILAPYLADDGKLTVAIVGAGIANWENERLSMLLQRGNARFNEKIESGDTYGKIALTELWVPTETNLGEEESYDMVVTFRNLHNWLAWGKVDETLAAIHRVLKPGGYLGLIDHRANPDADLDPNARNGYVDQDFAVKTITAAGFEFVGSSEINANANDAKDHPSGVWTLPPTLARGDENRARYLDIGESDRMTVLFRKPD